MRLSKALIVLSATALQLSVAWDEDPRCTRRRKLERSHRNDTDTDSRLNNDAPTIENPHLRHYHSPPSARTERLLRGPGQRNLKEITTFQLKMYHEEGYCWQDEWEDRKWCLECEGSSCGVDDYLWIRYCDKDEKEQRFVYRPDSGTAGGRLSPYRRQDLCWERTRTNAHQLRPCDSSQRKQIIVGIKFNGRFEMHPNGRLDDCLEQHHDPKSKEIVYANDCYTARKDHTNFWIMINKQKGEDKGTDGDDDDDEPPPGSDTINNLGWEYCDSRLCKKCQGDCDGDSQCEGSLKCFRRNRYERVPGCKGGTERSTRGMDFCYDPDDAGGDDDDDPPGNTNKVTYKGRDFCTSARPCGRCVGDCDGDRGCAGDLRCFQRSGNEPIPGCAGGDDEATRGRDFCFDPRAS